MIDNKLQFYQTRAGYDAQAEAGNIPNDALVFVKDTHEIITHGEEGFGGNAAQIDSRINNAISGLDSNVSKTAGADGLTLSITEVDGKITAIDGSIAANTYDSYGSANTAKTEIIDGATSNGNTLKKIEDRVYPLEEAVGSGGSIDDRIAAEGATHYLKTETYNKTELNNLITTPNQQYVTVTATAQTTAVTDVLPATGAADTTYRVGNWNGTQYSEVDYAEYAWDGSAYVLLSTKSQVGEVYDISANHADTKYADLAAALGTNGANIPQSLRKGGMSVKYVQSSDNNYVRYNLLADSFTTNVTNWQGVDDEPTAGSNNLVKSRGINDAIEEKTNLLVSNFVYSAFIQEQLIINQGYPNKLISEVDGSLKPYLNGFYRGIFVNEGERYLVVSNSKYNWGYGKYCLYAFYNGEISSENLVSLGTEIGATGRHSEIVTVPAGCNIMYFSAINEAGYFVEVHKVESACTVLKDEADSVKIENAAFIDHRPCFKGAKIIKGVTCGTYEGAYHLVPSNEHYVVLIPMNAISDWDGELYLVDKNGNRLNIFFNDSDNIYAYNLSTHSATQILCHYNKSINSKITNYEYVALAFTNATDYKNLVYASPTRVDGIDYLDYTHLPASVSKMVRSGNMCHGVTSGVRDFGNSYTLYQSTGSITHPIKIDKTKNVAIVGSNGISVVRAFSMYGNPIKLLTGTGGVIDIINDTDIQNYDGDVCIKVSSLANNAKFYVSQDETIEEINAHGILDYWVPSNQGGGGGLESVRTYNLSKTSDYAKNTMVHNSGYVDTSASGYVSTGFIDLGSDCARKVINCSYFYERILFYASDQSTIILVDSSHYYEIEIPDGTRYAKLVWKTNEASGDGKLDVSQDTLIATNNVCIGGSAVLSPYKPFTEDLIPINILQLWRTVGSNFLKNGFVGKILDSLGDSITEQRQYQKYVARYFGCSYDIHGIGGTQVAGTGATAYWQDVRINALNPKADFITIMGGVNDSSSGYPVGDLTTSNFDTNTFAGAMNTVINKIWHRYKMKENAEYTGVTQVDSVRDVKIILMTPTYIGGQPTKLAKIKEYAEAVIAIGKLWNIPVCDIFFQSNMGVQTLDLYWGVSDKTHPNAEGHKQIAALLINTLKSIEPYYSE